ncbi:hypothetical protein [Sphingopyxis sp. A083]|uniref:hypothetical protein n=1 Tax=Sphingopyxis sp. A083 TaxID=1759083 RepID=UPI00073BE578|nr:hypothetical protein [Sphingopyxis sp. A083]KTE74768.1 hypothetical protein ATE59_15735 [Sphingopyxis sp. A083]
MAYFAVSYQLNKTKDYKPLWAALAKLNATKVMRDFYLVDVTSTAIELRNYLSKEVDADDMIFVVPFSRRPSYNRAFVGTNGWIAARF